MWYGLSSILARFLNYLLTPYLTAQLATTVYGEMSLVYSAIPFINVIFTYGLETAFFRFSNKEGGDARKIYNTASLSLIVSTLLFTILLLVWRQPLAELLRIDDHPEFITWTAWIIALDTLAAMPFAKLRNDNRPRKYAFIKVLNIAVYIGMTVFFYSLLPGLAKEAPDSFLGTLYDPALGTGYVILANLIASAITLLALVPELLSVRFEWDGKLWKEMMIYSLPIMIAGFGGMINETFDRLMLGWWAPAATEAGKKAEVGIYAACYKLSILITLFVQAFRMGAEPFFFQQAKGEDAPKTYARVMNYFVITICVMFLAVALYLDIWKEFIRNKTMWEGLKVVPILLVANMCLGVYYNLSIWYKLSHNTRAGATITLIGAGLTLLLNYFLIPHYGYMACAIATLACYGSMMLISFFWGQKVYPVPYDTGRLLTLFFVMLGIYFLFSFFSGLVPQGWQRYTLATALFLAYLGFVIKKEGSQLRKLPVVGRFFA